MRAILRKDVIEQKHWNERQKIRQNISTWVSKDVYQAAEHCHYYFFIIINLFDLWPKYEFFMGLIFLYPIDLFKDFFYGLTSDFFFYYIK